MNTRRNRIAWRLANLVLRCVASEDYRRGVERVVLRGMAGQISDRRKAGS